MTDDPNQIGHNRPDLDTVKKMRQDYPSGWMKLSKAPALALLIDAVLDTPPGGKFTVAEISERAGISTQSVRNHISTLIETGIVKDDDSDTYSINDRSKVLAELEKLNSAVNAVSSGATGKTFEEPETARELDNSKSESEDPLTQKDTTRGVMANV